MASLFDRYTHPHSNVEVNDQSIGQVTPVLSDPLHTVLFPIKSAKGVPFKIEWVNGTEAIDIFGEQTFDMFSKYYRPEQVYLTKAILPNHSCFIVRLCDPDAKSASVVLEANVKEVNDIPQYQRDAFGALIIDEATGNPLPELDDESNPVLASGISIKYTLRQLEDDEDYRYAKVKTVSTADGDIKVYPIVAAKYKSPGEAGNKAGFKFYYSYLDQNTDFKQTLGTILYNFSPVEQAYNSDIASPVKDIYGSNYIQFTADENMIDKNTDTRLGANASIDRRYNYNDKSTMPYDVYVYGENIGLISDIINKLEDPLELNSKWLIDILSLTDTNGNPYKYAMLDNSTNSVQLKSTNVHYLDGGDDGDTSDEKFEKLYRELLEFKSNPELADTKKVGIRFMYDVGYSLETKYSMIKFMAVQKRCKVVLACQDISKPLNNMDSALSLAASLRTRALLTPESEIYGTGACRAEIFGQTGYLTDTKVTFPVPLTFWMCYRRSANQNTQYMTSDKTIDGSPNNLVDMYRSINFDLYSKDQKQFAWDNSMNYCEYKNRTSRFFASCQTIYAYQSSMLSDSTFTDCLIHAMYNCDYTWADWVSKKFAFEILAAKVQEDVEIRCHEAFPMFPVTAYVYQTTSDIQEGDIYRIRLTMTGYGPARRAESEIVVTRENLTGTGA